MFFTTKQNVAIMILPLVFLLGFNLFGQNNSNYPFMLKQVLLKKDIQKILATDLNADGAEEYLVQVPQAGTHSALRAYNHDLHRIFFQKNFNSEILDFVSYPSDSANQILIIEKNSQSINLLLIDYQTGEDTLAFFPLYKLSGQSVDVNVHPPQYFDLNGDRSPEIFLPFTSGLGAEIRALWAVDLGNKNVVWKYALAPNILEHQVVSLNLFENPLVLLSTQSPGNGYAINGMVDSKSYALVLNALTGNLIFLKELGDWPSYTKLNTLKQKNNVGLYSFTSGQHSAAEGLGNLMIWNPQDFSVITQLQNILPDEQIISADIDGDHRDEFIRSGHDNRIDIYNAQLKLNRNFALPGLKTRVALWADLNQDDIPELVCWSDWSTLIISDDQGNILASKDCDFGEVFPVRKGQEPVFNLGLYVQNSRTYFEYSLIPNPAYATERNKQIMLGFVFGLLFSLFLLLGIWVVFRKKWLLRSGYTIFRSLNVAIVISNLNGQIKYANPAMQSLLNLNEDYIKSLRIDTILDKLGCEYSLSRWMAEDLKQPVEFETQPISLKQAKLHRLRIRPLSDRNQVFGLMLITEDVSGLVNFKRSLAYTAMAQRLVHEIKNPLTTVKLTLQRLKMAYENEEAKKREQYNSYIDSVLEEVTRLKNVSDNFLKFFRADHPEFKKFNFDELIKSLVAKAKSALPAGIKMNFESNEAISLMDGDPIQLEVMLQNLIDNSIHAIKDSGYIEVHLQRQERIEDNGSQEYVNIEIEDNGCGIDEKNLERIFEPYRSESNSGTGLGLSIVKKIVDAHHGTITIRSKKDMGTFVTIALPVLQNEQIL